MIPHSIIIKKVFRLLTHKEHFLYSISLGYYMVMALVPTGYVTAVLLYQFPQWKSGIEVLLMNTLPDPLNTLLIGYFTALEPTITLTDIVLMIVAIFQISQGVLALSHLLNHLYRFPELGFFQNLVFSFLATVGGILWTSFTIFLLGFIPFITNLFNSTVIFPLYWLGLSVTLLFIYKYLPNRILSFKEVVPGALVGALIMSFIISFFGIYITHFTDFENLYGPMTWLVILLLLCQLLAQGLLIGAMLNVVLFREKHTS